MLGKTITRTKMSVSQQESLVEGQKQVIAELSAGAPNDVVRNCLRKYDPTKHGWQIENNFKKESKSVLVEVLAYLEMPDMKQYRADALPHELLCRIQNFLPDRCHLCKDVYCVKLGDKPILSCVRCGQGSHNACAMQLLGLNHDELKEENKFGGDLANPHSTLGLFYLCGYCQKEVIPQRETLKVKQSSRRNSTSSVVPSSQVQSSSQIVQNIESADNQGHDLPGNEIAIDPPSVVTQNPPNLPRLAGVLSNDENRNNRLTNQPNANNRPICKFYKTGRCKHGVSGKKDGTCSHYHPKPCRKFLANGTHRRGGCTQGTDCQFFHPSACFSSLKTRKYLNENCKYFHIKGTSRPQHDQGDQIGPLEQNSSSQRQTPANGGQNQREQTHATRRNEANHSVSDPFLGHLKNLQDQMLLITNKLQLLDSGFSNFCLQQQGCQPPLRYTSVPYQSKPLPHQASVFHQLQSLQEQMTPPQGVSGSLQTIH